MKTANPTVCAVPSFDKIKMDDRKRSLGPDADDVVMPRSKRIKDEHGNVMRMDEVNEKNVEVSHPPCALLFTVLCFHLT
jgi:hypothetical protein